MSKLETAAKPLLTPLITGSPCRIDETKALTIARWIAMKVLVGEHSTNGDAVTKQEERERFRELQTIPESFFIWIGRCGIGGWGTGYWRYAATLSLSPDVKPEHSSKNTQNVTFGIGELLISVTHTSVKNLDLSFNYTQTGSVSILHPFSGPIEWPPVKRLTVAEPTVIAHGLESLLRSDNVHWKPLSA